jgi:hypothetical protein
MGREELLCDFPYLQDEGDGGVPIVEARTGPGEPTSASQLFAFARDIQSGTSPAGPVRWLPPAVQRTWNELAARGGEGMLVIDSWDALIDQYLGAPEEHGNPFPTRAELENVLFGLLGRSRLHLALVLERDAAPHLEYLTDGAVRLERELTSDSRWERWLTLEKLRGVRLESASYPFTLLDSRFRAFPVLPPPAEIRVQPPEPDPEPHAESLWPASADFARTFGRLVPGTITLLQLDLPVPRELPRLLYVPLLAHVLERGGRVLFIPPPTLDPGDALEALRPLVSPEAIERRLRLLSVFPNRPMPEALARVLVPPHNLGWTRSGISVPVIEDPVFLSREQAGVSPNLVVAYFSGIEGLAEAAGSTLTREVLPGLAQMVFERAPSHILAIGRSVDRFFDSMAAIAELHLRVTTRRGRVMVWGQRPPTPLYALSLGGDGSAYRLTPML